MNETTYTCRECGHDTTRRDDVPTVRCDGCLVVIKSLTNVLHPATVMTRSTPWEVPAGEVPFVHDGERWEYVRCLHRGRQVTGYLRAADDMVYDDFRAPRDMAI